MKDNKVTIKMIETAINKGIRDIENNPKRGIRNLVDLANHFASGPFQKDLLELMQSMLANLDSPYYDIVQDLIDNVDHDTLKTFGINLGYNSWTYGARKISEHKKTYDFDIPWTIIFDFKEKNENKLDVEEITDVIQQGKEMGIYSYIFFVNDINDFLTITKETKDNLDCAFIIHIPSNIITEESIFEIKSYENTAFAILYNPSVDTIIFNNAIQLLRKNKCLFGLYSYYDDENVNNILSNKWTHEIKNNNSPFGVLIKSNNCSDRNASLIHDYVYYSRINQKHPTFLIDLYEDIARINGNISEILSEIP